MAGNLIIFWSLPLSTLFCLGCHSAGGLLEVIIFWFPGVCASALYVWELCERRRSQKLRDAAEAKRTAAEAKRTAAAVAAAAAAAAEEKKKADEKVAAAAAAAVEEKKRADEKMMKLPALVAAEKKSLACAMCSELHCKGQADEALPAGTRLRVPPHGEGVYERFEESWIGVNNHYIRFDSGGSKKVALKKPWAVQALSAEQAAAVAEQATKRAVEKAGVLHLWERLTSVEQAAAVVDPAKAQAPIEVATQAAGTVAEMAFEAGAADPRSLEMFQKLAAEAEAAAAEASAAQHSRSACEVEVSVQP